MARNLFAWASIGENGKAIGGKPGDQNGREVRIGAYYNFGQNKVIRFKSKLKGRKAAKITKALALCGSIGYNQNNRASLYNLAAKNGWNYKKLLKALTKHKVDCDCSALASTVVCLAFGRRLIPCCTTRTIASYCKKTKDFKVLSIKQARKKWHKGDMPVKAGDHIIINV